MRCLNAREGLPFGAGSIESAGSWRVRMPLSMYGAFTQVPPTSGDQVALQSFKSMVGAVCLLRNGQVTYE